MINNIDEIKAKSDIIEVISHFLPLRREGMNYKACCPFHNEKTPSFVISPQKQIFKCFSCEKSGDVINFLQDLKSLSFNEAVAELADMQGIKLETSTNTTNYKDTRQEVFNAYNKLFSKGLELLESNTQIKQYLLNRGLDSSDFATYSIGIMPSVDYIKSIFKTEVAIKLGILKKRSDGAIYTPYKERIIFAIRNAQHKIVGLAGRSHPYYNFRNAPKYINTQESFIYKKSENLYLFSNARQNIIKSAEVIIVEGYMDCIALHKMGFTNAVATSGTAFNNSHISALFRLNENIVFKLCFDNDEAGVKANIRALKALFLNKCYESKVLILDSRYKDIGEILESLSKNANLNAENFKDEIPRQKIINEWNGLKYYVLYNMKHAPNPRAKDSFLKSLSEMIDSESNYYAKSYIIDNICEVLNMPKDYFNKKQVLPHIKDLRVLKFLYIIYNDKDCAYIAKNELDLDAIPQEYKSDLKIFLESNTLQGKATNIALNSKLKSTYNQKTFYNDVLEFNMQKAISDLNSAKLKKDISQILALTQFIKEQQDLIRISHML